MPLSAGARIGPYEIVSWLGAGGMGQVYRARDSRLGRDVAIKLISEALATDASRVHRFEQEARAAGQLNHPNILAVYDVGTDAGTPFIVSELLEGESLRGRLANAGALPSRKAIEYARQVAEGLAAAHDKGIVHRDLKPDNLFITSDGRVKILDFGIAKLTRSGRDETHTSLATETEPGMVVGTAGYMSPEQVRGQAVDGRSDIFSFGAILYEMLTGHPAFNRATAAETMTAVLNDHPTVVQAPDVPPALERIVARCMEKARDVRFQSARDLAFALEVLSGTNTSHPVLVSTRSGLHRERLAWAVAALAVVAAAMLAPVAWRSPLPDVPAQVLSVLPPEGALLATEEAPAISPDGRQLAFVAYEASGRQLIFLRAMNSAAAAQPLSQTDGASLPFWSPDGRSIGFFAQGKLKTIDVGTGRLQTLADAGGARGGTWNKDDVIVFVPRPPEGPYRIPATGGEATLVAIEAGPWPRGWFPSFLPDGRHFLIFVVTPLPQDSGVFVASLDSPARTRLFSARSNAIYVAPGYLLFWQEAALMAQRFDAGTLELRGNPVAVASAVGLNPLTNQALFSVSNSGTLAFFAGAVGQSELEWVDRAGNRLGKPGPKGAISTVSLSPDATSVVYDDADPRTVTMDLWQLKFARGEPTRLTFNTAHDLFPLWSPDGTRIAFTSLRDGPLQMYELDANGGGNERLLLPSRVPIGPSGWSRDGRLLIYNVTDPKTSGDIWALPLTDAGPIAARSVHQPYPVVNTTADERYGTLAPDGHWLAYVSNETGSYEVYVRAFPGPGVLRQVSSRGGFQPQWREDGHELFYMAPDKTVTAMDFRSSAATFDTGLPRPLFATRTQSIEIQATARNYAVAPDGKRFLVANATNEARSAPITVVLNWPAAMRER